MKERLVQLLDLEQLTPSKFADIIGVQRSSVSHVISGRNNPGFDFLQKTLKAFPGLNADWLMLGEGTMYEKMGRSIPGNLFDQPAPVPESRAPSLHPLEEDRSVKGDEGGTFSDNPGSGKVDDVGVQRERQEQGVPGLPGISRRIIQVLVFYEDNTFSSYGPAQ